MALPAGLRKRGRVYYVQHKEGAKWRLTAVGHDLRAALERHAALRGADCSQGPRLEDLIEPWLRSQHTRCKPRTVQISRQRAKVLLDFFGGWPVNAITEAAVEEFIRWRREQGASEVTVNASLTTLRQVLRFGENADLISELPVKVRLLRTIKKQRRRTFGREEVKILLDTADRMGCPHVQAFIRIAASTGLRMDEILHLQWSDVDFRDRRTDVRAKEWSERRLDREGRRYVDRVCSWSPKTHQERSVWVDNDELFAFLLEYRRAQSCNDDDDWVFQGKRPGLRLTTIFKALRATFQWAGLYEKGKLAHTFRHSVATALLGSGVDIETVRDWLGHQQITTTALYLHASDQRKRRAAKRLRLV